MLPGGDVKLRPMPRKRVGLLAKVADAWIELYRYDERADAKAGSPSPMLTACARLLADSLTMVRITLSHARQGAAFEQVIAMAREQEAAGWGEHRRKCPKCGGH